MELLERGGALDELATYLADATAGHGRLVLVGGEAGVGKTALIRAFAASLSRVRLMLGACDPLSTPRPLGPLLDIATDSGGDLQRLIDQAAPRESLFRAMLSDLAASARPSVVVFEDVHWADEATFDLLRFLGRRIESTAVLLIASYRDDEVGPAHPLRVVMGDLATASSVRRMRIKPLSSAAVAALAAGSGLDPVALYRQTGGNPFFVSEVVASGDSGIPHTVRDAVLARAARLAPSARATLDLLATFGSRVHPRLLGAMTSHAAEDVEACVGAGMLVWDGGGVVFRHELARSAIEDAIPPHRSAELHARVLAILCVEDQDSQRRTDVLPRLAYHAVRAGDAASVLRFGQAAAERAAHLGAHREAAAHLSDVLQFATNLLPEERALILERCSYERHLTGQMDAALAAREEAIACWRAVGNVLAEGDNLRWKSRLLWFLGRNAEADTTAAAAVELLETLPPGRELAWACSNMSQQHMIGYDSGAAIHWGKRAIELAQSLGEHEVLVHALNNVGSAELKAGNEAGRAKLEASLALARQSGLDEHVDRALTNLAWNALSNRHYAEVDRLHDEALQFCRDRDMDRSVNWHLACQVRSYVDQGRWSDATEIASQILQYPHAIPLSRAEALWSIGLVRARRGDPQVWEALDAALELVGHTNELQQVWPVRATRAEAAWLGGDHAAARREAQAAFELVLRRPQAWATGELGYWLWRADALERPPDGAAEPFARQIAGDWEGAAALWRELGCPYELAMALADGDEPAQREALSIFERLGARPMAAQVTRRLRERGVRGIPRGRRSATRANPAQLTPRELEVCELVAAGLRNAEIATRLCLAEKTVDHHVSAVLAKLGVRSRLEAANAISGFVTR